MTTVANEPLEGYRVPAGCCDELVAATACRAHTPPAHRDALASGPGERLQAAGRRRDTIFMQQGITFEVADHRWRAPRPGLAARPRPAGAAAGGVDDDQARSGAADPRAERVRRRRLPRARDRPRGHRALVADRQPPAVRPPGARRPAARRRLLPRLRLRSRARRRRALAGARGQRPHARRASPTCSRTAWR